MTLAWRARFDRGNRRGLRVLQCGGIEPMTRLGSELERDLVSPCRLRGDQWHRECALRRVCGSWILARRVQLGDVAASRPQSRAAAPRSAV